MAKLASLLKRGLCDSPGWAWVLLLLLLPITTLPWLAWRLGGVAVAPASILPLLWLVFWFFLSLRKKKHLPFESIPFIAFVSVAILSSLLAFFADHPTFKASSLLSTEAEGLITLGIGAAFYFICMAWLSSHPEQLEKTLRLLNYAGLVMLLWSGLQAMVVLFFQSNYPEIMVRFQQLFNTRGLFEGRITGFSFEPSWLAHQINLLFLPFWLAASIKRVSVHRFRLWKFTLENLLLVLGVVVVFLSSRIGALALLLVIGLLAVRLHLHFFRKLGLAFNRRVGSRSAALRFLLRVFFFTAILCALILVYLLALVGLLIVLSNVDPRIARIFNLPAINQNLSNPYELFNQLSFAERYVYWVTGWRIFNDHPLLGVGLGNAGLYFQKYMPSYSWVLPEVMESFYRGSAVMNVKSLWVRLLAETGLVGFAAFLGWYAVLWRTSRFIETHKQPLMSMIGLAGQLVLVALLAEGFSIDTFALPYLWISLGILSAVAAIVRTSFGKPAPQT